MNLALLGEIKILNKIQKQKKSLWKSVYCLIEQSCLLIIKSNRNVWQLYTG